MVILNLNHPKIIFAFSSTLVQVTTFLLSFFFFVCVYVWAQIFLDFIQLRWNSHNIKLTLLNLFWERERTHMHKCGKGQKERDGESPKQAPCSGQTPTRGLISQLWEHDLSQNQWPLVYVFTNIVQPPPSCSSKNILKTTRENPYPLSSYSLVLPSLGPLATRICFLFLHLLILDIPYKWNPTIWDLLCLASFT